MTSPAPLRVDSYHNSRLQVTADPDNGVRLERAWYDHDDDWLFLSDSDAVLLRDWLNEKYPVGGDDGD